MRALWLVGTIVYFFCSLISAQASNSAPAAAVLPPCALSCQNLLKAQSTCSPSTPVAVLPTNTTTYRDCLCHNNLVTPLAKSPNGVCDSECPIQKDRDILQNWFVTYCKGASTSTAAPTAPPSSTLPASTSTATLTSQLPLSTSKAAAAAAATSSAPAPPKRRNGLSKKATIGVAVGISVAMIVVAAAVYFPLLRAAGRAMRSGTPIPSDEKEEQIEGNVATANKQRRNDEEDAAVGRVRIIPAFKQ